MVGMPALKMLVAPRDSALALPAWASEARTLPWVSRLVLAATLVGRAVTRGFMVGPSPGELGAGVWVLLSFLGRPTSVGGPPGSGPGAWVPPESPVAVVLALAVMKLAARGLPWRGLPIQLCGSPVGGGLPLRSNSCALAALVPSSLFFPGHLYLVRGPSGLAGGWC